MTQKILKVGTSAAVTIPKKALEMLGFAVGDNVNVEINEKAQRITIEHAPQQAHNVAVTPELVEWTKQFIHTYHDALEELAQK